ncbi:MAG: hypothetical protein UR27_C0015G0037 [Candidatus Peregrinibacteria bacterium GW2011_GWA2_33_10]|nr:MAG: hypothetical protein UR27_C0015G0037 [Candidatus Peregrinibacteria bacterium GW2011_GWA2_33_10]KKP39539.1 MAG: hypothetical protein UR30_C0010G0035 [Candidatus Peregrinibacteria bacterium GW2011_GWC2_33_13]OGJ48895.1 MAG: hypothetical protein A2229_00535 [Candidatus Peregrinibacteria bacterium RIFOXYA2_FULL_33_7]
MKPKIALLFCGGTIGMVSDQHTNYLKPANDAGTILSFVPELKNKIQLDFYPVFNIDSSNMTPHHWNIISTTIKELYNDYDGFVVAQGTDTMAYTSSAISFTLQNLSKPIVFTGSMVPLSELGADGRTNLIYSCMVASMDIAEVCIVFGWKIIRANRSKKNHESFVDVFGSPNYPLLGEIERPIRIFDWAKKRRKRTLKFQPEFESNIRLVKLYPGFQPDSLERMVESGAKGIIIEGFGAGNIPFLEGNSILPYIKNAIKHNVPIILTTQLERSKTNLKTYEAGYKALELGVIPAGDMTVEAIIAKLMWALKSTNNISQLRKIMQTNLVGELTEDNEENPTHF